MHRSNTTMRTSHGLIAALGAAVALTAFSGLAFAGGGGGTGGQSGNYDPDAENAMHVWGILREFRMAHQPGGHPDMEVVPDAGMGVSVGNVEPMLDPEGKPIYKADGYMLDTPFTDASGNPIAPNLYDAARGDTGGGFGSVSDGGVDSAESFREWFRDAPDVNSSALFPITLYYNESSGTYVFDDRLDTHMAKQFGGSNKNRNFTYEVDCQFTYIEGANQAFTFGGDDAIWVFINNQLVADLGGAHEYEEQTVELDRLGLTNNTDYTINIFYANRIKNTARLRIETSGILLAGEVPGVAGMFD